MLFTTFNISHIYYSCHIKENNVKLFALKRWLSIAIIMPILYWVLVSLMKSNQIYYFVKETHQVGQFHFKYVAINFFFFSFFFLCNQNLSYNDVIYHMCTTSNQVIVLTPDVKIKTFNLAKFKFLWINFFLYQSNSWMPF